MPRTYRVGLISDTHALLRPQALDELRGSDFIVHAGDIGEPGIVKELSRLAPVTAVRGNNDHGRWADALPQTDVLELAGVRILVIHDLQELEIDAAGAGFHVVVAGHSHRPVRELRDGVLFVNPGSAGPRRFKLPISVGRLTVSGGGVEAELIELRLHESA